MFLYCMGNRLSSKKSGIPPRRVFIATGIGLAVGCSALKFFVDYCDDDWSFLDVPADEDLTLTGDKVAQRYVLLERASNVRKDSDEFKELKADLTPLINKTIQSLDDPTGKWNVELTRQTYGVPEDERFTTPLVAYCEDVVEFLYERIKGLDQHTIDWTVIKNGEKHDANFNGKGFIAKRLYTVTRASVTKEGSDKEITVYDLSSSRGGYARPFFKEGKLDRWHLAICSGTSAVISPFSEVLPLTTLARAINHPNVRYDDLIVADETLVESISTILALEYGNVRKIKNIEKTVREANKNLTDPKYQYVPKAIEYVRTHGVQTAFDLYVENPNKFMQAIKS